MRRRRGLVSLVGDRWLLVGSLIGSLASFGCGPTVARPAVGVSTGPTPTVNPPAATGSAAGSAGTSGAPPAAAPTTADKRFFLGWSKLTKPFVKGLAFAPSGHVGVLSSRHLSLHDGRSGKLVGEVDVCFTFEHALAFVDEKTAALVCENGVKLFHLPDLSYRGVRPFSQPATAAGFANGKLVVAFSSGPAKV